MISNIINKKITIPVWALLIAIFVVGTVQFCNEDNDNVEKKLTEASNQIIEFYNNNDKMPQMVLGSHDKFFYDTEHIMLIKTVGDKRYVEVTNYKSKSMDEADEIWDFVDMFQGETSGINRVLYRYDNKSVILTRK